MAVLLGLATRASLVTSLLLLVGSITYAVYKSAVLHWDTVTARDTDIALITVTLATCLFEACIAAQLLRAHSSGQYHSLDDDETQRLLAPKDVSDGAKDKGKKVEMVPFSKLFRYATSLDFLMIFVASVCFCIVFRMKWPLKLRRFRRLRTASPRFAPLSHAFVDMAFIFLSAAVHHLFRPSDW